MAKDDDLLDDDLLDEEVDEPAPSFKRAKPRSKGMSIFAKLKKVKPLYLVLGAGGLALAADYYIERENSVAMKLYREVFGKGHHGGRPLGGAAAVAPLGRGVPSLVHPALDPLSGPPAYVPQYGDAVYYPAFAPPMYAPHYRMRHLENLHRMSSSHGFGGRGGGRR